MMLPNWWYVVCNELKSHPYWRLVNSTLVLKVESLPIDWQSGSNSGMNPTSLSEIAKAVTLPIPTRSTKLATAITLHCWPYRYWHSKHSTIEVASTKWPRLFTQQPWPFEASSYPIQHTQVAWTKDNLPKSAFITQLTNYSHVNRRSPEINLATEPQNLTSIT